eukprot:TRINITY_DN57396_c0_g1_i1.p1 TRINITY_DN57396_c0_g1~~TRINITY_DN57396_c0_g1_i1.p1  ORF type:complete len:243 (+),score=65.13 TRINITY_DN57396_c0_g1_i1:92-730(+)
MMDVDGPGGEPLPDLSARPQIPGGGPSAVLDWLWVGGDYDDREATRQAIGISAVLNVRTGGVPAPVMHCTDEPYATETYMWVPLSDYGNTSLAEVLPAALDFISAKKAEGRRLLVHCVGGINRACTVTIAWLHERAGLPLEAAAWAVRRQRPCARVHLQYWRQLWDRAGLPLDTADEAHGRVFGVDWTSETDMPPPLWPPPTDPAHLDRCVM